MASGAGTGHDRNATSVAMGNIATLIDEDAGSHEA
jgi:hypothetical protein